MKPRNLCSIIGVAVLLISCSPRNSDDAMPLPSPISATLRFTPTTSLSAVPIQPSVRLVGEEEMVFDWSLDHCAEGQLPDLPVRAFRDAEGSIQMNLSFTNDYRLIGPDLDTLELDCTATLISDRDIDPSRFNFLEWMGATYTLDGQTVYALIHNEFNGNEASRWQAARDFSASQGRNDWRYQSWNGSSYRDMRYDNTASRWQGPLPLCQVGPAWMHPDPGCQPTRTWVSPLSGQITISGSVQDLDDTGGNGVRAAIFHGEQELWSADIENGDSTGQSFKIEIDIARGDQIHFRIDARGDAGWDNTLFEARINLGPDPCPSGLVGDCHMMSITFAVSTDGGRSYSQPLSPEHLVAAMPYRYEPGNGQVGIWSPSNIVFNPQDGYYYALVQLDRQRKAQADIQGTCVMRTQTLDDPKSWRAWDGQGFNMQFANPYEEDIDDPKAYTCRLVSPANIGALTYSLTYNTYFERFIAVGTGVSGGVAGFYFSLSEDLIHWTPKQLLWAVPLAQSTNFETPYFAYPSLIDPDSASINFDTSGQTPYMYFTRFNGFNPMDFDLMRVRLEFDR